MASLGRYHAEFSLAWHELARSRVRLLKVIARYHESRFFPLTQSPYRTVTRARARAPKKNRCESRVFDIFNLIVEPGLRGGGEGRNFTPPSGFDSPILEWRSLFLTRNFYFSVSGFINCNASTLQSLAQLHGEWRTRLSSFVNLYTYIPLHLRCTSWRRYV